MGGGTQCAAFYKPEYLSVSEIILTNLSDIARTDYRNKIFNADKTDYDVPTLFLGSQNSGLFDTVNKNFPEVWSNYKTMKSQDWDENEFDYASCVADFQTCPKSVYDIMIRTLAFQWGGDSAAAKTILPVAAPFISSSELQAAWTRITDNEIIHAATYSEIIRCSFTNPKQVLGDILSMKESLNRLDTVAEVFANAYRTSHLYALDMVENNQETYNAIFMFTCALLALERVQFMSSFAITFTICDTGLFVPIGKAIQKIAQDELEVHVELDKLILRNELKTERGRIAYQQCKPVIQKVFDEVTNTELRNTDYMFSEGRELLGSNADLIKKWVLFNARDIYSFMGLKSPHQLPTKNPLRYMENWLDISKTQASPQEEQNGQYKVGIMRRDDSKTKLVVDF